MNAIIPNTSLPDIGLVIIAAWASAFIGTATAADIGSDETKVEFFEKKVRPILADHCYHCHSADTKPSGGLRVDDRNGLLIGGDGGAAIVAGDPEKSLLIERVLHENPKRKMPKEGELLTAEQVDILKQWIRDGVAWPRERIPAYIGKKRPDFEKLKAEHWAWQPLKDTKPPEVGDAKWVRDDVDRFILATLEAKGLKPVGDADATTLVRRVKFDLTGLPPTPGEIEAFKNDRSPDALAKLVDRLLASPQFGERWGRHWLDVARYGESTGPSRNIPYPHAWKYRDYVIDAVNRDVPFDRFLQEQIAGDLLPAANDAERNRLLTATGFLALGVKDVNQRFKTRFLMDNVDEQIDTVSRSVLALTVSCARCHDHKFDPIPVTDYYALAGIFSSTENAAGVRNKMGGGGLDYYDPAALIRLTGDTAAAPPEKLAKLKADLAVAKKAWDEIRGTPEGLKLAPDGKPTQRPFRLKFEALQTELNSFTDPAERGLAVHGVREGKTIGDTEVRIRGEAERIGPTVPRGYLTTFTVPDAQLVDPQHSGRLELARWLTSPRNPLTARVAVNRVWQNLFGTGLVSTVDNFGVKGDAPSHPDLLDFLAQRFIREGWSVKKLVRELALTRAYQLGTDAPAKLHELDPDNRLVWRHSPRRLSAEELRDAILVTAGRLDTKPAGPSPVKDLKMIEMRDNGPEARKVVEAADNALARSVYLPLLRGVTPKALEAFDPVCQTLVSGRRESTTVPTQALYFLNSTFVRQQALALAERLLGSEAKSNSERIEAAHSLVLGRKPTSAELDRAARFLDDYAASFEVRETALQQIASAQTASGESAGGGAATAPPGQAVNPDDVERTPELAKEAPVKPKDTASAAWMSFVQALYASAEFRFVP
jgi:hypothetical protein